jgi:hypothetical protein
VTREFAPEPSKLIVRWTITWEADNGPGTVNGSSTFRLNDAGLVAAVTDQWEVRDVKYMSRRRLDDSPTTLHAHRTTRVRTPNSRQLRILLEGGGSGSCLPAYLRGAGKVAEIRVTYTTK